MPSTFSPNLRFEEIQNGEQANTWGTTTNNNIGNLIGQAIAGLVQVDVTGADVTLLALDGAVDQARAMFIEVIGSPGATRYVSCPDGITKAYVVINNSDSPVIFDTVSGAGVSVPSAGHQFVYTDGTDVLDAVTSVYTFTASRALVSSSGGNIDVSATTAQQIGWLSNVTSDVQAQINTKLPNTTGTTAQLLANNGAGGLANVNIGSGLQYLPATNTLSSLSGGGSVTSVAMSVPGGFTLSGSPITGAGTLALGLSSSLNNAPIYVNSAGALATMGIGSGLSFSGGTLSATSTGVTSVNGLTGAVTLNYSNVGAPSTTGSGASGTWGINISGAAASATNASYATSAGSASTASSASYASSAGSATSATSATSAGYATGASIGGYTSFAYFSGSNWLMVDGSSQLNTNSHPLVVGGDFTAYTQLYVPNMQTSAAGSAITWDFITGLIHRNSSSLKYKLDVKDAWYGLADVLKLRPVTYEDKHSVENNDDHRRYGGLIAEELDAAGLKEFVVYDEDGAPDAIQYGNMVSLLINAVKELSAKVAALEAR